MLRLMISRSTWSDLIDAHSLLWAMDDPAKLGPGAVAAMQDPANELLLSAGTIWELAIKVGLKKLSLLLPFRQWVTKAIADLGVDRAAYHNRVRRYPGRTTVAPSRIRVW